MSCNYKMLSVWQDSVCSVAGMAKYDSTAAKDWGKIFFAKRYWWGTVYVGVCVCVCAEDKLCMKKKNAASLTHSRSICSRSHCRVACFVGCFRCHSRNRLNCSAICGNFLHIKSMFCKVKFLMFICFLFFFVANPLKAAAAQDCRGLSMKT